MKVPWVSSVVISCFLVHEYTAQKNNLGVLPAGAWQFFCDAQEDFVGDVPPFLLVCAFSIAERCVANISIPLMRWLECAAELPFIAADPPTCTSDKYPKCNLTCSGDPGWAIYQPLYEPDQRVRIYSDIFDQIHHVPRDYIKSYVNTMRATFEDAFYSKQYNYQWMNNDS